MTVPRVAVVLLNWNNYPDTKACLDSLAQCDYPNFSVVVTDNGSKDGSGDRLRAEYPQHTHVANGANLGFARGCNAGIRKALEDPATQHVLLLNNDAVVRPGFLEPLVAAASDPSVGAASGKVVMGNGRIWYAGGRIARWRAGVASRAAGQIDQGQYDQAVDTEFVTGAFMLIPRRTLETVGPLPEEYFFGFEEYDYSLQLLRRGYRLRYEPSAVVVHAGDGSHGNWDPKYLYNSYRNKLILARRHLPLAPLIFPIWRMVMRLAVRLDGERKRRKWLAENTFTGHTLPDRDRFDFALDEAIRDHRTGVALDEAALTAFDARWKARAGGR